MTHHANPRGQVLHGEARCPHCERRTNHTIQECAGGRRLCKVCSRCGRHAKIMDTSPRQVETNRDAKLQVV